MTWLEWVLTATTMGGLIGWTMQLGRCHYLEHTVRYIRELHEARIQLYEQQLRDVKAARDVA